MNSHSQRPAFSTANIYKCASFVHGTKLGKNFFQQKIARTLVHFCMRNVIAPKRKVVKCMQPGSIETVFSFSLYFLPDREGSQLEIPVPGYIEKIADVIEVFQHSDRRKSNTFN